MLSNSGFEENLGMSMLITSSIGKHLFLQNSGFQKRILVALSSGDQSLRKHGPRWSEVMLLTLEMLTMWPMVSEFFLVSLSWNIVQVTKQQPNFGATTAKDTPKQIIQTSPGDTSWQPSVQTEPKEPPTPADSETKVVTLWWLLSRSLTIARLKTYFSWETSKDNLLIPEIGAQAILLDGPLQINCWFHSCLMSPFNQFILKVSLSHRSECLQRRPAWNGLLLATKGKATSEEGTMQNGLTLPAAQQQAHSVQTLENGFPTPKMHKILLAPQDSQPNSPCTFHKQWVTFTSP